MERAEVHSQNIDILKMTFHRRGVYHRRQSIQFDSESMRKDNRYRIGDGTPGNNYYYSIKVVPCLISTYIISQIRILGASVEEEMQLMGTPIECDDKTKERSMMASK